MTVFYFGADASWEEIQNTGFTRRNTCILQALSQNNKIEKIFVVQKIARGKFLRSLISNSKKQTGKVHDINYASLFPEKLLQKIGLDFLNKKINSFFIRRRTKSYNSSDLIWCYWPKGYLAAKDSGLKGKIIFDADHNIIDDPNVAEENKIARTKLLIEIGKKATYILSSTFSMINWFQQKGFNNCVRLRNGVFVDRFKTTDTKSSEKKFTIGYCGTLSKWIDYDLFEALIKRNGSWNFIIIGSPYLTNEWEKLQQYPNVEMLGRKTADEVAHLIPTFDVAINLYHFHPALDVDSMKLYEYIAAGVPVVSTPFHEHLSQDFDDLLSIGKNISEIENIIHNIQLNGPNNTSSERRNSFLKTSSWNNRVNTFIDGIK
ncbi:MAG: glycosyltransferase [Bacteroidota bacterium]